MRKDTMDYNKLYQARNYTKACASSLTNDSLDVGPLERGQTEVPYLDEARRAVDEDVVALEVAVDDWGQPRVQEGQASQDLSSPAADHLGLDGLQTTHVAVRVWGRVCVCVKYRLDLKCLQ